MLEQKEKDIFPLSRDMFLDSLFFLMFSLVAITSAIVLIEQPDFYVTKVYLVPLWDEPYAYASLLGALFYLACFYKFRSWKYALTICLFYDGVFEIPGSIDAMFKGTWQSYQTPSFYISVIIALLVFNRLKVKYNIWFWFAIGWLGFTEIYILFVYNFVPSYTELPILLPLAISLYLGINKPEKNILTQSQPVTNISKQESMMK